jgi:hypothetical protein
MGSARRISRIGGSALSVLAVVATMTFAVTRADVPRASPDRTDDSELAGGAEAAQTSNGRQGKRPKYLQRVVIARMYQNGSWTIPAVKDATKERKIAYVCEALAYLKPTYVSGLVRLGWKDDSPQKIAEEVEIFDGVRDCVRKKTDKEVKFDVVLNALHYTDPNEPDPVANSEAGTKRMRERLQTAQKAFHPDGWFFDFFASPYKAGANRYHRPLEAGIEWIHGDKNKPRQFVGGTVWGTETPVPQNSDFLSVTDRGGADYTRKLVRDLASERKPLLMHIDNSPTDQNSKGSTFYSGERDREQVIRQQVRDQDIGYRYMFPVFFPTKFGSVSVFDMREHPGLFKTMCRLVRNQCDSPPGAPAKGTTTRTTAPSERTTSKQPAPPKTALRAVARGYHRNTTQHLYSLSSEEIRQAPGVRLETGKAFHLAPAAGPGLTAFHRCYLGNGWHVLTTVPGCEGVTGAVDEGPLGYLAATQLPGTVPLHRMFRPDKPDHFYTTSAAERDAAAAHGYRYEYVAGYVWPSPAN